MVPFAKLYPRNLFYLIWPLFDYRRKFPLHECLILELREAGYQESSDYLQDLIYDNMQLVAEDDIGIVVDLRKRVDYLEHICEGLIKAEKERDKGT